MTNVIQMPALDIETQLAEIRSIADTMLYTHEQVDEDQRKRIMDNDIALLFIIVDKIDKAMKSLERINRFSERMTA